MDIVFVRTKLQATIVNKLIERGSIGRNFIFVKNYWKNTEEDSQHVYNAYDELATKSKYTTFFIEQEGIIRNTLFIWILSLIACFSGGKFFFAGINLYSFALVRKFNPFLKIYTFDDGAANIRSTTIYYSETPLPKNNKLSRSFINALLPNGAAFYTRQKISKHFSIYPNKENIVSSNKIEFINLDWNKNFSTTDKQIIHDRIFKSEVNILIGTAPYEHQDNVVTFLKRKYQDHFDLILLHPRDTSEVQMWKNAFHFESLAEGLIAYLIEIPDVKKCNIYHFNSSALDTIQEKSKLNFVNLLEEAHDYFHATSDNQLFRNEKILVYVDTFPHLRFARDIEKFIPSAKLTFITSNLEIFHRLDTSKDMFLKRKRNALRLASKEKESFDALLAARVDDLNFQLLYKLLSPTKLYTFDEGLFTIQLDSIYNSQLTIPKSVGWKYFLSSKLINFPMPAAFFYQNTDYHFTKFKKQNFDRSLIDADKVLIIDAEEKIAGISSIFVGQPWQFMYLSKAAVKQIAKFINNLCPEIYLIHPREDFAKIDKYLNPNISRVICKSSAEDFINRIIGTEKRDIYTVASTLVVGLSEQGRIRLVTSEKFDERVKFGQQNLVKTLDSQGLPYKEIKIDHY